MTNTEMGSDMMQDMSDPRVAALVELIRRMSVRPSADATSTTIPQAAMARDAALARARSAEQASIADSTRLANSPMAQAFGVAGYNAFDESYNDRSVKRDELKRADAKLPAAFQGPADILRARILARLTGAQ